MGRLIARISGWAHGPLVWIEYTRTGPHPVKPGPGKHAPKPPGSSEKEETP